MYVMFTLVFISLNWPFSEIFGYSEVVMSSIFGKIKMAKTKVRLFFISNVVNQSFEKCNFKVDFNGIHKGSIQAFSLQFK